MALTGTVVPQMNISVEGAYIQIRDVFVNKALKAHATADIFKDGDESATAANSIETIKFSFTYNKASATNLIAQAQAALKALTSVTLVDGTARAYNLTGFTSSAA